MQMAQRRTRTKEGLENIEAGDRRKEISALTSFVIILVVAALGVGAYFFIVYIYPMLKALSIFSGLHF